MKKYLFGIDVGGTTVKMGLFENTGELIDSWEIDTDLTDGGKNILSDISDAVSKELSDKNIDREDIEGIGLCVPGPVMEDGTVTRCVNLGWGVFNVVEELQDLTGFRVKAGNDANVATYGELLAGGGKGLSNLVMVTFGTAIGGGIIVDGKMLNGAHGAGGEIGHMPVNDDEPETCGCGKKGCFEQYASASRFSLRTRRYLKEYPETDTILKDDCSAKDIFDAAKAGDKFALERVDALGKVTAKGFATISATLDPEAFLIGGGMSKGGTLFIDAIKKYYKDYAFHATRDVQFLIASLGNDAGIYGAAGLILND